MLKIPTKYNSRFIHAVLLMSLCHEIFLYHIFVSILWCTPTTILLTNKYFFLQAVYKYDGSLIYLSSVVVLMTQTLISPSRITNYYYTRFNVKRWFFEILLSLKCVRLSVHRPTCNET